MVTEGIQKLGHQHAHLRIVLDDKQVFATANGGVKRTALAEFAEASGRKDGLVAMKLAADDRIVAVFPGWEEYELLLAIAEGETTFAEAGLGDLSAAGGIPEEDLTPG